MKHHLKKHGTMHWVSICVLILCTIVLIADVIEGCFILNKFGVDYIRESTEFTQQLVDLCMNPFLIACSVFTLMGRSEGLTFFTFLHFVKFLMIITTAGGGWAMVGIQFLRYFINYGIFALTLLIKKNGVSGWRTMIYY